jgi:hypothetical protein
MSSESPFKKPPKGLFGDLVISMSIPFLIGKSLILYFGLMYSAYPGEGYGVWLIITIVVSLLLAGRFLWKHRDYDDG